MQNGMEIRSKERFFYGWYILIGSFIILFFNAGAVFSIGVMFKPMINDFGWSRGTFTIAYFVYMAVYAISLLLAGKAYDRCGPKWVIATSSILLSGGFMGISFVTAFWQYITLYGVVAAAGLGGTTLPIFGAIISKWFEKYRGLAMSLAFAGAGVGQFVIVPLITSLVQVHGWRTSFFLMGLGMMVVNLLLAFLVIKGNPDDLGYAPLGTTESETRAPREGQRVGTIETSEDLGLLEAMRTSSFWFFTVVMVICGSGDFFVSMHLVPFVTDHGISPTGAGNMLAWLGLMSLVGVLLAGPAADLVGSRIPIALTFLMRVILFLIIINYKNVVSFNVFTFGFGFTLSITAPITTMLVGRMFGFSNVGLMTGFIATVHHLSGGAWAYMGGLFFDRTGNYQSIFTISAIMAGIALLCSLFIKERRHKKRP